MYETSSQFVLPYILWTLFCLSGVNRAINLAHEQEYEDDDSRKLGHGKLVGKRLFVRTFLSANLFSLFASLLMLWVADEDYPLIGTAVSVLVSMFPVCFLSSVLLGFSAGLAAALSSGMESRNSKLSVIAALALPMFLVFVLASKF